MENDEKVRKIMKNQRKILENEENVRKNEGKPMKNQGKVMENKEKVRKPCPRPKKNKIPKTRKKNPQKNPHPMLNNFDMTGRCIPKLRHSCQNWMKGTFTRLVGGLEHVLFSIIYGIILPID